MKLVVIGDIHLKEYEAEQICENFPDHKKIFIGDYFDDFNDTPHLNELTADWLKSSLQKEDRIHLFGNHDFHYFQNSKEKKLFCSGFSWSKYEAINKILTPEDWSKLKFFHSENGWWFSHAGVTEHWFAHPIHGITEKGICDLLDKELQDLKAQQIPKAIWSADYHRGGDSQWGGILWADWRTLQPLPGIKQIVGHTPHNSIQIKKNEEGIKCVNVDCNLREFVTIDEEGELEFFKVDFVV